MAPVATSRPDWFCLHLHALQHLPRVLAGMGFVRSVGPLPWGGTPLYDREKLLRYRRLARPSPWEAQDRAALGALNRAHLHEPVRLMVAPRRAIYVSEVRGDWSDPTGGARGESLIELGMLMWGQPWGKAAFRIARLCGLDALPHAA